VIDTQRRASCETSRLHYRLVINAREFALQSFADTALRDDDEGVCAECIARAVSEATSTEIDSTRIGSRIDRR